MEPGTVIAVVGGSVAVVGIVVYFFVSNKASERREEYMKEVNAVLTLLHKKASDLVKRNAELNEECDRLRQAARNVETLEAEIARLDRELARVNDEISLYGGTGATLKKAETIVSTHIALSIVKPQLFSLFGRDSFLRSNWYLPKRAMKSLVRRRQELEAEIE